MKALFILMMLAFSLFAGTQYKTPAFEVKELPLYCSEKDQVLIYKVGDIVDGDYVINHCSKNKDSISARVQTYKKLMQIEQIKREARAPVMNFFILIGAVVYFYFLWVFAHQKENEIQTNSVIITAFVAIFTSFLIALQYETTGYSGVIFVVSTALSFVFLSRFSITMLLIFYTAGIIVWCGLTGTSAIGDSIALAALGFISYQYLIEQKKTEGC